MSENSSQKGFSLVESIIAISILGVTMLGIVQLFAVAIQQGSFARNNNMALSVAQQKLEQLQTEYTNELENGTAASNLTAGTHGPQTLTLTAPVGSGMGDRAFEVSWAVTITGPERTVVVEVVPVAFNDMDSKTLSMTAIFSP